MYDGGSAVSQRLVLICLARTERAVLACTVYSVTAWLLFHLVSGRGPLPP
ncbi:hypothetical protein [Streptomyces pactum]|nr:hypothetical protein [Streptomyces pactum]